MLAGEGGHSSPSEAIEKHTLAGDGGQGTANSSMNSSSHSNPCTSGEGGQTSTTCCSTSKPSCALERTAPDATPETTDVIPDSAPATLVILPAADVDTSGKTLKPCVSCPESALPVPKTKRCCSSPCCTAPDSRGSESLSCDVQVTRSCSAKAPETCTPSSRLWSRASTTSPRASPVSAARRRLMRASSAPSPSASRCAK